MNIRLDKAEPVSGAKIRLEYADGLEATLDLSSVLHGPVFELLKDPKLFFEVRIESETIQWPNGADVDPSVLRLCAESGRVLNQEETDAWFEARQEPVQPVG